MLNRLVNTLTLSKDPYFAPSALLVVGTFGSPLHFLHLVPENGTIERFRHSVSSSIKPFSRRGFKEQAREQIGTVTCYIGDGETTSSFLHDVENRVRKLWNDFVSSNDKQMQAINIEVDYLVQNILQPAVMDAMHERHGRDRSMNATQTYPVHILRIMRSREGSALSEPTSFS